MKRLILLVAFLAIFFLFLKPPTDPDLFWHLRYGEEILKTGQIPSEDKFSFTFSGYRAADSWWLSEVLIYFLVAKTGFFFPALLFAFLGAVIFLAVGLWARVEKVNILAISGAAFFGAIVSWPILGLRPQTISLVHMGLVYILLQQFWQNRGGKLILFLPLIFLLWANLHAGFMLGLALIWLFWGAEAGRFFIHKFLKIRQRTTPFLQPPQLKILLGLNLLSTAITLANPYGLGLWQTVLNDASSSRIKSQIAEWLPVSFRDELGLLFLFYLLALVVLAHLGRLKLHYTRFLILLTFCFLALAAVRHVPIFVLLATPLLAEGLTVIFTSGVSRKQASVPVSPAGRPGMATFDFPHKNLALTLFFLLFALAWAWETWPQTFQATRSVKDLAEAGLGFYQYPYQAVEYLKAHPQERIFNEYGWGGYLIWQLPQNKTFIDGRMPGWKREGREIFEDYQKVTDLKKDLKEVLDFWQIEAFLIPVDFPLAQYLKVHPEWEKKYEDETAAIFVKR